MEDLQAVPSPASRDVERNLGLVTQCAGVLVVVHRSPLSRHTGRSCDSCHGMLLGPFLHFPGEISSFSTGHELPNPSPGSCDRLGRTRRAERRLGDDFSLRTFRSGFLFYRLLRFGRGNLESPCPTRKIDKTPRRPRLLKYGWMTKTGAKGAEPRPDGKRPTAFVALGTLRRPHKG